MEKNQKPSTSHVVSHRALFWGPYFLLPISLNILNFRKLVIQRVCLLMFKISKCDVPKPLHSLFRINNSYHNYQTRRSESIHVPIGRTEAIYKTFSYFGAHIWNHISNNISTNVSYSSFKHLVKFYIQNNSHVIYRLNI